MSGRSRRLFPEIGLVRTRAHGVRIGVADQVKKFGARGAAATNPNRLRTSAARRRGRRDCRRQLNTDHGAARRVLADWLFAEHGEGHLCAAGSGLAHQLSGGEIAQCDFWFPPIRLPVGFGQTRAANQLPVLTMITGCPLGLRFAAATAG
jgi:hypothetical protein